uniref:Uncharacterized protein n=1 Tax=Pararge aegeria TaxID=116150 RepID=S4NX38_9NEOP
MVIESTIYRTELTNKIVFCMHLLIIKQFLQTISYKSTWLERSTSQDLRPSSRTAMKTPTFSQRCRRWS